MRHALVRVAVVSAVLVPGLLPGSTATAESAFAEPSEGYVDVHEAAPGVHELLEHIEQFLTDAGKEKMKVEVGEALIRSLATHNGEYVNQVVDAWLRTLYFKSIGLDEVLDRQEEDPITTGEAPVSLSERRSRLR